MRRLEVAILVIVILSFSISFYFYPTMPEMVASHWNARGEVDGYMPKLAALFLIPFVISGLALFLLIVPKIDPLKENIEQFRNYYDGFVVLFLCYMLFIHIQLILWNIGIRVSPNTTFPLLFGILFIYIGFLLENAKRNWFVGIRTPWTLSSGRVWEKTHKIGGKLFKLAGIASFTGFFFQDYALYFILIPVFAVAIYSFVYSYFEYQREMKGNIVED
ncbi:MAG: SdpI family protein [Archaeoglobus sp.]|nr:SdpI family protein [Archaeoglobus sp.]